MMKSVAILFCFIAYLRHKYSPVQVICAEESERERRKSCMLIIGIC